MSVKLSVDLAPGAAIGQVAITAQPPSQVVPAIATSGYLAANRLGVGSTISVSLSGFSVTVRIVASVANFPTVFGQNGALIAGLAEINDLLAANQVTPLPVIRWWLRTADSRVPPLPACSACPSPTAPASRRPCSTTRC